jgi:hypothetical protein
MAKAFRCDRCGEFERGQPDLRVNWTSLQMEQAPPMIFLRGIGGRASAAELCDSCAAAFQKFFEYSPVTADSAR